MSSENSKHSKPVPLDCALGSDIAGRPDMTTIKIAKLKMLAEAVLKAHKGQGYCKDCLHVEYVDDYQRCHGGEYDCCKCSACNEARRLFWEPNERDNRLACDATRKTEGDEVEREKLNTEQASPSLLGVIRAFRVKAHGTEAIVFATSASKARYGCYFSANDAGYRTTFADISVKRAPEYDCREDTNGKIPRTGLCLNAEYLKRV